uniref:Uncharacterized protein n=1 Tax=Heterosigma akashiwo TaxID=2829 RepID=A0A6V1LEE0_HETAK
MLGEEEEEEEGPPQQRSSFCLAYSPAAATNIVCGTSNTQLLGPPLRIWDKTETPSPEVSLCGEETESSSSDRDSAPSSSEEEDSSGDECRLVAGAKRDQRLVSMGDLSRLL